MMNFSAIETIMSVLLVIVILFVTFMKYVFEMMDHDSIKLYEKDVKRILKTANNSDAFNHNTMIDFYEHDQIPLEAANEMIAAKYNNVTYTQQVGRAKRVTTKVDNNE